MLGPLLKAQSPCVILCAVLKTPSSEIVGTKNCIRNLELTNCVMTGPWLFHLFATQARRQISLDKMSRVLST